ncbi:MAG: nickel-binding protein [Chitinophagaceae bacterium]
MPLYMDVHIVPGVKATGVAQAHQLDLVHQDEYNCKCMTYWIDEVRESVFCLIEAPTKEAVIEMHSKAHGLVPNKVIEVSADIVESFLGRIYDPEEAETTEDGLKVFTDPSFRVLLVIQIADPVLLQHQLGKDVANELFKKQNEIIRKNMKSCGGSDVEHPGAGYIISFASAGKAVSCALSIHNEIPEKDAEKLELKISINGGEPIEKSNKLFGDTIQKAQYMCAIAKYFQVAMASTVKELVLKDHFQNKENKFLTLSPQDEAFLTQLFNTLEEKWQDADFNFDDYSQAMAMSKSQLYRKTISLTGLSPNIFLKEYRLEKAKELLRKKTYNISQITFNSGFTSPSYFTKCFKTKYGLLPHDYLDLVQ